MILYALIKNTAKRRNAAINFSKKHIIYSFIFLYISIESIAIIMYYHTILSFAMLIPLDLSILALTRIFRKTGIVFNKDYSEGYTSRLRYISGENTPDVYIYSTYKIFPLAYRINEKNIIAINSVFLETLNSKEVDSFLLQIYYNMKFRKHTFNISKGTIITMAYTDIYLLLYVFMVNINSVMFLYIDIAVIVSMYVLIIFNLKARHIYSDKINRATLSGTGDIESLKSLLLKEITYLPVPLSTKNQHDKIMLKRQRIVEKTIKRIYNNQ